MLLETLKESYIQTLIEPRLSGKMISEETLNEYIKKIGSSSTFDEFLSSIPMALNADKHTICGHVVSRIMAWEEEKPFLDNPNSTKEEKIKFLTFKANEKRKEKQTGKKQKTTGKKQKKKKQLLRVLSRL